MLDKTKQETVPSKPLNCDTPGTSKADHWTTDCDNNVDQNSRTRGKLEQLRLVMGERRERRKQRKQKVQPYTLPIPLSVAPEANASDTITA